MRLVLNKHASEVCSSRIRSADEIPPLQVLDVAPQCLATVRPPIRSSGGQRARPQKASGGINVTALDLTDMITLHCIIRQLSYRAPRLLEPLSN